MEKRLTVQVSTEVRDSDGNPFLDSHVTFHGVTKAQLIAMEEAGLIGMGKLLETTKQQTMAS